MAKKDKNDFTRKTRDTLAKRAGQQCSNPDCTKITTGPHADEEKHTDFGIAAHIRGARPTSARFDPDMIPEERSRITNGIWLCGACSKLIDDDELTYTVEVLYDWKRTHEREIRLNQTGKSTSWQIRDSERKLEPFKDESLIVQQIILDQSKDWQLFLARELLRSNLTDILREHDDLKRGLIYRNVTIVSTPEQFHLWFHAKTEDLKNLFKFINVAIKEELNNVLRDYSNPAQAQEIKRAIDKILTFCRELLNWDIDCHFTLLPEPLKPIKENMLGWSHQYLLEIKRIPNDIAGYLSKPKPKDGSTKFYTKLTFGGMEGSNEILREFDKLDQQGYFNPKP